MLLTPSFLARLALALTATLLAAPAILAAPGYTLRTVALEGDPAPGTSDSFGAFFDVALDDSGGVAFAAPLASGFPNGGAWLDPGSGPILRFRNGDPAPSPITGSYVAFGSFARLDGSGRLAVAALVNIGGSSLDGLFLDTAGVDSSLVFEGETAPVPPGGTLDATLGDIGFFGMNAAGDISFRSDVTGGTRNTGVFVRASDGTVSLVVGDGDTPAGGGPDAFQSFGYPAINDIGSIAFAAQLTGGSAAWGLFVDAGSGPSTLAIDGDSAPDTGGGSFVDFLYPAVNSANQVAFLADVSGGTATGGVFLASPAITSIVVEGQSVPGAGPVSALGSVPAIAGDGSVAVSMSFASGPVDAGVYVHSGGEFEPVAVSGESVPDGGGATFASFGFLAVNDDGQIAFIGALDDGRTGVFVATPEATAVPTIPLAGLALLALLFLAAGVAARRSASGSFSRE